MQFARLTQIGNKRRKFVISDFISNPKFPKKYFCNLYLCEFNESMHRLCERKIASLNHKMQTCYLKNDSAMTLCCLNRQFTK